MSPEEIAFKAGVCLVGWGTLWAAYAETTGSPIVKEGSKVYRVWGSDPASPDIEGVGPYGASWTTINPKNVSNYRSASGIFHDNTGRFVSEGILKNTTGVMSRQSLPGPLTTNTTNLLPEVMVPNPATQIELIDVYGVNPPF